MWLANTCQQLVSNITWPKPVSSRSAKQPGQNLSAAGQQNNLAKTCQQLVSKTTWSKPVSSRSAKQPGQNLSAAGQQNNLGVWSSGCGFVGVWASPVCGRCNHSRSMPNKRGAAATRNKSYVICLLYEVNTGGISNRKCVTASSNTNENKKHTGT